MKKHQKNQKKKKTTQQREWLKQRITTAEAGCR